MSHKITLTMPETEVKKVDHVIRIEVDGAHRGEIHFSRGGVDFWPTGHSVNYHGVSWAKLCELIEKHGKPKKR